tara:strand:- start:3432 stop:3695 length:264 start_codon:yes stop_codon:yes gene_type:complete
MEALKTPPYDVNNTESSREVFVRLANSRVNKVLSSLDVLKKLSSRKSTYTQKDVLLMKKHLHAAVDEVIESFNPSSISSRKTFSLDI